MLQSIERYMKQAIVDKNHAVASAALASSLVKTTFFLKSEHFVHLIKKWYEGYEGQVWSFSFEFLNSIAFPL